MNKYYNNDEIEEMFMQAEEFMDDEWTKLIEEIKKDIDEYLMQVGMILFDLRADICKKVNKLEQEIIEYEEKESKNKEVNKDE
jgi:cob(I)alamin adenosyltransferase